MICKNINICIYFAVVISINYGLSVDNDGDICTNAPFGMNGTCQAIENCTVIAAIVKEKEKTPIMYKILENTRCGFIGSESKHCCPDVDYDNDEETANRFAFAQKPTFYGQWWLTTPSYWESQQQQKTTSIPWWERSSTTTTTTRPPNINSWDKTKGTTSKPWWLHTSLHSQRTTVINTPSPPTPTPWWLTLTTERPSTPTTHWWYKPVEPQKEETTVDISSKLSLLPLDTCGGGIPDRIVGGTEVPLASQPWIARIGYKSRYGAGTVYSCGGSLITKDYVVTAAHCMKGLDPVSVLLGEHDIETEIDCENRPGFDPICSPKPQSIKIAEIIIHPDYSKFKNDIGLFRLEHSADLSSNAVQPICLPIEKKLLIKNYENKKLFVAGWGRTESGIGSRVLLGANVPIVNLQSCKNAYKANGAEITNAQICAGDTRDSCQGDSGGPLTTIEAFENYGPKTVLVGVVSFGPTTCGTTGKPGVYAKVSHYLPWILQNIR